MNITGIFGLILLFPVAGIAAAIFLAVRLNSRR
jgi:hypothetical protein